jgi:ferric-dicitrate binding protein FerR (iron transport regulator)
MARPEDEQAREARAALERVQRDSEVLGASTVSRTARRLESHFGGRDAEIGPDGRPDPIELWGRRIGRAISVVVCAALAYWLGVQLGWWPAP